MQRRDELVSQPLPLAQQATGQRFYGKYRGTVVDNVDLTGQAMVLAELEAFPGMMLNWALPCVPYAGIEEGFHAVPPLGANVWIEFEGGDPSRPIWTGCFWEKGTIPLALELSPEDPALVKVFRSKFCTLIMNDTPGEGGITLNTIDPAVAVPLTVTMTSAGIELNAGAVNILMNPEEGITVETEETVVEITAAGINVTTPVVKATADVNITGATQVTGDTTLTGALQVNGESNFALAVTCEGEVNVTGALTCEAEVNVAGVLTVEGGANMLGAMAVEGEANFALLVTIEGDMNLLGAGQVEGNFAVAGVIEGVIVPPI